MKPVTNQSISYLLMLITIQSNIKWDLGSQTYSKEPRNQMNKIKWIIKRIKWNNQIWNNQMK